MPIKNKLLLIYTKFLTYSILFVFVSCNSKDENAQSQPPQPAKEIQKINFFLETSASMQPYMKASKTGGPTFFKDLIISLPVDIQGKICKNKISLNYYAIGKNVEVMSSNIGTYMTKLSDDKNAIAKGDGSDLAAIIDSVILKTDSSTISIFISDCILSGTDKQIKSSDGKNYNIDQIASLKGRIKTTLYRAKDRGIALSIFGFNSKYNGEYWDYQNTHKKLPENIDRPFYVWILGQKELVSKFKKELSLMETFKPQLKDLDFGMFEKPIEKFDLLFKSERTMGWAVDPEIGNGLKEITTTPKKPIKFSIAVDLSSLPEFAREITYLSEHIVLDSQNCKIGNKIVVKKVADIDFSNSSPKEKIMLQQATHIFTLQLAELIKSPALLRIKLPLRFNEEYKTNWTIMDDRDLTKITGRTFALEHLIDAVKTAYENQNDNFINISINLKN